jgi:outer membrane receptor protein involved in Fe transport
VRYRVIKGIEQVLLELRGQLHAASEYVYYYHADVHDKQYAVFGEVTYSPVEPLALTAGLRGYRFETFEEIDQGGILAGPNTPNSAAASRGVNPKLTGAWKFTEDANVYATAAKGFRAGGPNAGIGSGEVCTFASTYRTF